MRIRSVLLLALLSFSLTAFSQHNHEHGDDHHHEHSADHNHGQHAHDHDHDHADSDGHAHNGELHCGHHSDEFNPGETAFHHIADANVYSIGPLNIPLPCMLYAPEQGWDFFLSSKFHFDRLGHGDGHMAYNRYVLDLGSVKRVIDDAFPMGQVEIDGFAHRMEDVDGEDREMSYVCYNGEFFKLDSKSTADGGLFGGGNTSFYDFSLTKNVTSMIIVFLFLTWLFIKVARAYKDREGQAPKGLQSFIETFFVFIQDEVAKPFLGSKYMKYLPFLMCLFFFILGLNLFGQIPFLGGSNVTGNLAVTMVLAVLAFIVTNISGNKHYWEHVFWMPGVPAWVKTILTPVEILGVFIKPLTLMLRLFANITAGHMVMVIFVGLIFVFSKNGASPAGGYGMIIPSGLLTLFMMSIELLVAFIQAFVFTILTASYIGAAIEEHH